jgi:long-chain acyl-CoA synthetase
MSGQTLPAVPQTVVHMLLETAAAYPEKPAVSFGDTTLTYAEYRQAVLTLAAFWRPMVNKGDRVALLLSNSLEMAVGMFAAHALGAQAMPLNPGYTERELEPIMADGTPCLLVHEPAIAADLKGLCNRHDIARLVVGVNCPAVRDIAKGPNLPNPEDLPNQDMLATLQYTGGTTGISKGVNITHRQLATNLAQREALLPTNKAGEVMLCSMPLFHVSAVAMCLYLTCYAASHLVILPRYRPDWVLDAIAKYRVTLMSAAPTIFHSLLAYEGFADADLDSLQYCYSGAAPLPEATLSRWEAATGCVILEGYGMTEAGPVMAFNPVRGPRKPGSVGIAPPGTELQIVSLDDRSRVLPAGETGEIRVRGPHVMAGYRNQPGLTQDALRDGWMYSGDLGFMDEDGYLFIRGRSSEVINVGGYGVYPREIEQVLLEHAAVTEAAVFGVPDSYYGEAVQAYVVLKPGQQFDEQVLIAHCRANLVGYKVPNAIRAIDELPKTRVGKLARRQLEPIPALKSRNEPTRKGGDVPVNS